jgi:hypothetical protein
MKNWKSFFAMIITVVVASIVINQCTAPISKMGKIDPDKNKVEIPTIASVSTTEVAPDSVIVRSYKTGHIDLSHAKVLSMDRCNHRNREYECLWVRNGKDEDVYIMVLDNNHDEVFQLKQMPNGKRKEAWARGKLT